jgi:hypothetical protein
VHPSCHRKAHSNLDFKEFFTPAYCGGNRLWKTWTVTYGS